MDEISDIDSEYPLELPPIYQALSSIMPEEKWKELRLTDLDQSVTPEKVEQFLSLNCSYYLFGEETAENHHYHASIVTTLSNLELKNLLYEFFDPPKNKKGHLAGNSFFELKDVNDIESYFPYCCKDGIVKSNLPSSFVKLCLSLSYKKPLGYEKDLAKIYKNFQENLETNPRDLWEEITLLRSFYDLRVNRYSIAELVDSQIIKKHPEVLKSAKHEIKFIAYN